MLMTWTFISLVLGIKAQKSVTNYFVTQEPRQIYDRIFRSSTSRTVWPKMILAPDGGKQSRIPLHCTLDKR